MAMIQPVIGNWYKEIAQGAIFEVVAVDISDLTIETQLIDGEIAEYDFDSWKQMLLVNIEEPEDWRSPFEMDDDEYYAGEQGTQYESWNNPLNNIESDIVHGIWDE